MNVLQSFMGCMYPGSIKTESIESLDHDPGCRFQVSNIDEKGNEISIGEIHLTEKDLVYYRPEKHPIQWNIACIRRYGCNESGQIFLFETGRQSTTGEGIYAFHLDNGQDLVNKLKERIEKHAKARLDENRMSNNSNNQQNRSSFKFNRSCFGQSGTADQPSVEYNCLENQNELPMRNSSNNNMNEVPKSCQIMSPSRINETIMNIHTNRQESTTTNTLMSHITESQSTNSSKSPMSPKIVNNTDNDSKPYSLSYLFINPNVTQFLDELAKDHAANRQR